MPAQRSPPSATSYLSDAQRVVDDVIAPAADDVDRTGTFPRRQIEALAEAGLLALTVPEEFGGGGAGLRAAADVVRAIGAACGSTAMVVTMHYSATAALIAGGRADIAARDRRRPASEHARLFRVRLPQPFLGAGEHSHRGDRGHCQATR